MSSTHRSRLHKASPEREGGCCPYAPCGAHGRSPGAGTSSLAILAPPSSLKWQLGLPSGFRIIIGHLGILCRAATTGGLIKSQLLVIGGGLVPMAMSCKHTETFAGLLDSYFPKRNTEVTANYVGSAIYILVMLFISRFRG